mmetsp:Transcript_103191/g.181890  ORF Transcript_103191/g.181890 Transcript_103191/m.181890 type:complete len:130 (+) Transcript_103191:3-392(+)
MSRTRIYKMSGIFGNRALAEVHAHALKTLETLRAWDTSHSTVSGRPVLFGLSDDERIYALAGAEVSQQSGIVVSHLAIYPAQVNKKYSFAAPRMVRGLRLLSSEMGLSLDMSKLHNNSYPFIAAGDTGA